jgi:hypothetical protein
MSDLDKEIKDIKEKVTIKKKQQEQKPVKVGAKRIKHNDSSESEGEKTDEEKQINKVEEQQNLIYDSLNNMGDLIEKFINTSKQLNFNENSQIADEDKRASFEADDEEFEEF